MKIGAGCLISLFGFAAIVAILVLIAGHARAGSLDETRYCGIIRNDQGKTLRSPRSIAAFKKLHPCPVTGKTSGACKGWAIDHVVPLDCGGCDAVSNMQWLPATIKSCKGTQCKDRWERRVYYNPAVGASKGCHP